MIKSNAQDLVSEIAIINAKLDDGIKSLMALLNKGPNPSLREVSKSKT